MNGVYIGICAMLFFKTHLCSLLFAWFHVLLTRKGSVPVLNNKRGKGKYCSPHALLQKEEDKRDAHAKEKIRKRQHETKFQQGRKIFQRGY